MFRIRFELDPEIMKLLREIAAALTHNNRQQEIVDGLTARLNASNKLVKNALKGAETECQPQLLTSPHSSQQ